MGPGLCGGRSALLRGEFGEGDTIQVDAEKGQVQLRLMVGLETQAAV